MIKTKKNFVIEPEIVNIPKLGMDVVFDYKISSSQKKLTVYSVEDEEVDIKKINLREIEFPTDKRFGEVAECVFAKEHGNEFWLKVIDISDPKHRKKGLGTLMLEYAEENLGEWKIPCIKSVADPYYGLIGGSVNLVIACLRDDAIHYSKCAASVEEIPESMIGSNTDSLDPENRGGCQIYTSIVQEIQKQKLREKECNKSAFFGEKRKRSEVKKTFTPQPPDKKQKLD